MLHHRIVCHAKFVNMKDVFVETTTPYDKIVDDEIFSDEQITWTVDGKIHRENELANHGDN